MDALDVELVLELGEDGAVQFEFVDTVPVNGLEELVLLDVDEGGSTVGVLDQNGLDEVDGVLVEERVVEGGLGVDDLALEHVAVVGDEGRVAGHEFVEEAAQVPDVVVEGVLVAHDHLGRQLLRGAHELVREELLFLLERLGESEVDDDRVSVRVEHDVLRLEVALDHVLEVQLFHAHDDLAREELEHIRLEVLQFLQVLEQFTIFILLSHEEEFGVVLEAELELRDEGFEPELLEDLLLVDAVHDLPLEREVVLDEHLERVDLRVQFAFHQLHPPERTHPY